MNYIETTYEYMIISIFEVNKSMALNCEETKALCGLQASILSYKSCLWLVPSLKNDEMQKKCKVYLQHQGTQISSIIKY